MRLWLTPLRCPRCGASVPHRHGDLLLACLPCGQLYEVRQGTPVPVPLVVPTTVTQAAAAGNRQLAWLPFWCFQVTPSASCGDASLATHARELLARWTRVFVSGTVHLGRPDPYRFDLDFTQRELETQPVSEPALTETLLRELYPCPRSAEAAARFVAPYLICLLDPLQDVTHLEVSSQVQDLTLVAVPFVRIESGLHDAISGHVLSQRFLVSPKGSNP